MSDIVYKPPFVTQTTNYPIGKAKVEWPILCFLYGKRITLSINAIDDDDNQTIYEPSAGKVFLLLHASLSMANGDVTRKSSRMNVQSSGGQAGLTQQFLYVMASPAGQGTDMFHPCIPMLVFPGEKIVIRNDDTDCTTVGTIFGYEIDQSLFNQIF